MLCTRCWYCVQTRWEVAPGTPKRGRTQGDRGCDRGPMKRSADRSARRREATARNGGLPQTRTGRRPSPVLEVRRFTAARGDRSPGARPGIRTQTYLVLSKGPLPVGLGERNWCARLDSNQHYSPPQGDASCRLGYARLADGARIERAHPPGLGAVPTRCITSLPTVLADGPGIEPG